MDTEELSILYNKEAIFAKLFSKIVGSKLVIQSTFHKKLDNKLVKVKKLKDYLNTHCKVVSLIKIEGTYIGANNESIQVKLPEVGILKESVESPSLMSLDMLDESESEDEQD